MIKVPTPKFYDFSIALIIFAIACLLFLKKQFVVSADLLQYLVIAENYLATSMFFDVDDIPGQIRPTFTLFLSELLKQFDKDLIPITTIISIVSALLPISIYFLTTVVSTRSNATFVALFVVLTPEIIFWVPRHLDGIWPTLIFAAFAFILRDNPKPLHILLGSLCACLAVLIKVAAAPVFAILPAMLIHKTKVNKNVWLGFYFVPLAMVVFLSSSWAGELIGETASLGKVFIYPSSLVNGSLSGYFDFLLALIYGALSYFFPTDRGSGIFNFFPFYTVLFVCFFVVGFLELRQRTKLGVLFIHYWFFAPFIAYCGLFDLRFPQFVYGICLPYIYLVHGCTHHLAPYIKENVIAKMNLQNSLTDTKLNMSVAILTLLCLIFTSNINVYKTYKETLLFSIHGEGNLTPSVVGVNSDFNVLLSTVKQVKGTHTVAFDNLKTARQASFYGDDEMEVIMLPWIYLGDEMTNRRFRQLNEVTSFSGLTLVKANSDNMSSRTKIKILNSQQIIEKLEIYDATSVIVMRKEKDVLELLKRSGNFSVKKQTSNYVLFELSQNKTTHNCEVVFGENLDKFYKYLSLRDGKRDEWYFNEIKTKIQCKGQLVGIKS
ncbi:hypothetical protein N9I56_04840 [Alphaproteobacteria bacterium]|nr:hypothetical protein [Alphaproteobacteria bacterium]